MGGRRTADLESVGEDAHGQSFPCLKIFPIYLNGAGWSADEGDFLPDCLKTSRGLLNFASEEFWQMEGCLQRTHDRNHANIQETVVRFRVRCDDGPVPVLTGVGKGE